METTPLVSMDARRKSVTWAQEVKDKAHAEMDASFLSKITFSWLSEVVKNGYSKPYQQKDLPELRDIDTSKFVYRKLLNRWMVEMDMHDQPSLARAIRKAFGFNMYVAGVCKFGGDMFGYAGPICLNLIIKYLENSNAALVDTPYYGLILCIVLFVSTLLQTILLHQHHYLVIREGIHARSAIIALVYRKSLAMTNSAKVDMGTGRIINHQSTDANRVLDIFYMVHYLWAAPLQVTISLLLLVKFIGYAAFAGVAVMLIILPVGALVAYKMGHISKSTIQCTDRRVKLINEILQGIRVVKLYSWEAHLTQAVHKLRTKELKFIRAFMVLYSINEIILQAGPVLVALCTFLTYSWTQSIPLTADMAFSAVSLFGILRLPLMILPRVLTMLVQAIISVGRIQEFLRAEELEINTSFTSKSQEMPSAISVKNSTFFLDANDHSMTLSIENFQVHQKELMLIIGPVGSGKTTLVNAILGQLNGQETNVNVNGSVAYISQQAWVLNTTLKENILFGLKYDSTRFQRVLMQCALEEDVKMLLAGVDTEIGERGVTLSGGQKQRVSIARAMYADKDIYVFDDCLSALDSHVGQHIFEACILNGLKNKTRVLVTHAVHFADKADKIVIMNNLQISDSGTFAELKETSKVLQKLQASEEAVSSNASDSDDDSKFCHQVSGESRSTEDGKIVLEEERAIGSTSLSTYYSYLYSCGPILVLFSFMLLLESNILKVFSDVCLSAWTTASATQVNTTYYTDIYVYVSLATVGTIFISSLSSRLAALRASHSIHSNLLDRIVRSPMQFFDTTPLGRIMNRFSNDINTIDQKLGSSFVQLITTWLGLMGMVLMQCIVSPYLLLVVIPSAIFYGWLQQYYRRTSRELQRLDSVSKSPIYAHLGQTLNGLATIRSYERSDDFIAESDLRVDNNTKAFYLLNAVNRWLGVRLEFVGAIITLCVALLVTHTSTTPGAITLGALILSYSQGITSLLNWTVRASIDTENMINSIERTDEYMRLDSEAELYIENTRMPLSWPQEGKVSFKKVFAKYRDGLEYVIRGCSFDIHGGEKVGICGRTGSGKSTIMLLLFRIIDGYKGTIEIDDVDISTLGLHDLRSRLSIIPQDPVLFADTIRFNLDPSNSHSDMSIWEAVSKAQLRKVIENIPGCLDANLHENGENLSVGQRQLFCLARALLRQSRILLLDEATASVDKDTDAFIQQNIRTSFKSCTVITIAHRLETIMDYDRILVLDNGNVEEFDTPRALLSNSQSALYQLAGSHVSELVPLIQ